MARSMFALPSTITQVLRFFQVTNSSKTANEKKKKSPLLIRSCYIAFCPPPSLTHQRRD